MEVRHDWLSSSPHEGFEQMRLKSRPREPSPSLTRVGANFYSTVKQQDYSASVWLRRKDKLEHPPVSLVSSASATAPCCWTPETGKILDQNDPPDWVPDEVCSYCTACKAPFTVIRRKHHCRSCGKIFCSRCSSHSAPLPRYGQMKPVRVCTHCYMFHVTPFYSDKAGI